MGLDPLDALASFVAPEHIGLSQPSTSGLVQVPARDLQPPGGIEIPSTADEEHMRRFDGRRFLEGILEPRNKLRVEERIIFQDQRTLPLAFDNETQRLEMLERTGPLPGTKQFVLKVSRGNRGVQIGNIVGMDELVGQPERLQLPFNAPPAIDEIPRIDDEDPVKRQRCWLITIKRIHQGVEDIPLSHTRQLK